MENMLEGVGVTPRELAAGTVVMVPVGRFAANINGQPCVVAWAVVRGPVNDGQDVTDPAASWWLDVYTIPGGDPMPQMYRAGEILGVPALGLSMDGAPTPEVVVRGPGSPCRALKSGI
jgi:hypothetical protein